MTPPGFVWLPLAILGFLVLDTACLLAAAWIVVAWGKRRDRRLGHVIGITLKTISEKEAQ